MKLLIYPAVSERRLEKIRAAAAPMTVVQAKDEAHATLEIADADVLFGYLTPRRCSRPPVNYAGPNRRRPAWKSISILKLVASPVIVTNMRGIFSDVIADHVFGYILCFAKNFHVYIRQQQARRLARPGPSTQRMARLRRPRRSPSFRRSRTGR